ncbi:MAG TPA: methanogenesis marker protein 11 [Methanoregulaceae archaeon]|nr:methanogenesis marker protein 11 [Methanoregulaceae archaeon]
MASIVDPYIIHYPQIIAVVDDSGTQVELIEFFECTGGAMWAKQHYAKSPLVRSIRNIGQTMRYMVTPGETDLALEGSRFPAGISAVSVTGDEVLVSYVGLGGGGVGASVCRSYAQGIIRCVNDPSGGGKRAGSTIWLPRRQRVLIGVDDTDTPDDGATWTLVHNIAKTVEDTSSRYVSHTIVQLFPVQYRTKNCVSLVVEFASTEPARLAGRFLDLLDRYTLSEETGMAVYTGFDPSVLLPFAWSVKQGEVGRAKLPGVENTGLTIMKDGRGIIGAVAAIPFYTRYEEALMLFGGKRQPG